MLQESKDLNSKCIVCNATLVIELQDAFDTRFGIKHEYSIGRCSICGTQQIVPLPSMNYFKALYKTYYNFGGEKHTVYKAIREYFFSSALNRFWLIFDGDISFHSRKGFGHLLDVGCNEGRNLSIYQKNGFNAEGLELNENAAAEAAKRGFNVFTKSLETFQPNEQYSTVVLSNVLEHSLQPKEMLLNVTRILKKGGQVWISCPNVDSWQRLFFGKYWINWHVPFHIVHFTKDTLTKMLHEKGFEVLKAQNKSPALWLAHSIITRLFSKLGKPTKQLRNPFLIAPLILAIRFLLFPVLWLGNLMGSGDCLVIVARKV